MQPRFPLLAGAVCVSGGFFCLGATCRPDGFQKTCQVWPGNRASGLIVGRMVKDDQSKAAVAPSIALNPWEGVL